MASEIRVNKLNSQTGVGTITLSPTGVDISGITTTETLKATTGIVTTLTATTGIVTTFEATTGNITTLRSPTGIVTSLEATTGNITTLRSPTGIVTSLEATTGNITTLRAPTGIVTTFVTNTAKVGAAVTITSDGIDASGIGITCANVNGGQIAGRRNIIINGAMQISQRGPSSSPTNSGDAYPAADRFIMQNSNTGAYTVSQSTTVPDNQFKKSLKVDVTTADTALSASQYCQFQHRVEAQNLNVVQNFRQPVTFSFWVRSNKTGNYSFTLQQMDNGQRQMAGQYTINAADTWEKKIITIPPDSSGAVNNDNGLGLTITWGLAYGTTYTSGSLSTNNAFKDYANGDFGAGQGVNLLDSTSNEWYLTGVQMEVGTQATPFEHLSIGEELMLCRRYYLHIPRTQGVVMNGYNANSVYGWYQWPVEMRVAPTNEYLIAAGAAGCALYGDNASKSLSSTNWNFLGTHGGQLYFAGTFTQGSSYHFDATPAAGFTSLSAEL